MVNKVHIKNIVLIIKTKKSTGNSNKGISLTYKEEGKEDLSTNSSHRIDKQEWPSLRVNMMG